MGGQCIRSIEPTVDEIPYWLRVDHARSASQDFEAADIAQGSLEARLEQWTSGSLPKDRRPSLCGRTESLRTSLPACPKPCAQAQTQTARPNRAVANSQRFDCGGKASPVALHLYNLLPGTGDIKSRLPLGTFDLHCGVEVFGCEWTYMSKTECGDGTGVLCCKPRDCCGYMYCETVKLGCTRASEDDVLQFVQIMKNEWLVSEFDVKRHNCFHFCSELCHSLNADAIPSWVAELACGGHAPAPGLVIKSAPCCTHVAGIICCTGTEQAPDMAMLDLVVASEEIMKTCPGSSEPFEGNGVQVT